MLKSRNPPNVWGRAVCRAGLYNHHVTDWNSLADFFLPFFEDFCRTIFARIYSYFTCVVDNICFILVSLRIIFHFVVWTSFRSATISIFVTYTSLAVYEYQYRKFENLANKCPNWCSFEQKVLMTSPENSFILQGRVADLRKGRRPEIPIF